MDSLSQNTARKGPFGLEMGMNKNDYPGTLEELKPGLYQPSQVPKGHSAFESYVLQFGPSTGLSWIKAVGNNINTNSFGSNIEGAFEDMKSKLTKTYGEPENISFLMPGSIWNEPQDWMQALLSEDRFLAAKWEANSDKQLPNHLSSIYLYAKANDTESGYLGIEYAFENNDAADEEIAALEDDAL